MSVAGRADTRAWARVGIRPSRSNASWSEPPARSSSRIPAQVGGATTRSIAIGRSSARRSRSTTTARLSAGQAERGAILGARVDPARVQHPRRGSQPAPPHALGERERRPEQPRDDARGREGPLATAPDEQPLVGEQLDRLSDGHPADPEALAQLGLGRQPIARSRGRDEAAQVIGDLEVARRHRWRSSRPC